MSLTIAPDVEFARCSFVHSKLANNAPIHANSAGFVTDFLRQKGQFYGTVGVNVDQYTPPIYIVDRSVPTVALKPERPWDPAFVSWGGPTILGPSISAVPLPANFAPSAGSDAEAVIIRPSTGEMWDLWTCSKTGAQVKNSAGVLVDEWRAGWGGHMTDLRANPGWFYNGMGVQASGIAFLATIMTIKEQQAGVIRHPLQLSMPQASNAGFVSPARRSDGGYAGPNIPLEGSHWRFPANIDFTPYNLNKYTLMVATAIRDYGMILSDQSGAIVLRAENPLTYPVDPYTSIGGIFGATTVPCPQSLYPYMAFANMPWNKLQVLA